MPYLAFARKWRPSRFGEVVGQSHVITTLQNAIAVQRIGHAYLFSGPRGVGKTTIARIFAKAVNCQNVTPDTPHPEPCNECATCTQINTGKSFDVIEVDAASNRGIDEIRELRENVKLAPALCRYKVYIIDEVHMLTQEAFNALLKTLEEPPGHVIFILATTERHRIPLTILSRCQPFDFSFIPHSPLVERLRLICADEGVTIDDDSLALIAEQSEGCLRDAQNILEQLTASAGNSIDGEEVHRWLGLGSQYLIDQLIQAILASDLPRALRAVVELGNQGADISQCLRKLITYLADLRRLKIDPGLESVLNVSSSTRERMQQEAVTCSAEQLTHALKALVKASHDIRQYGFEQLQLESALVTICRDVAGTPIRDLLDRLRELETKLELRPQSFAAAGAAQPQSETRDPRPETRDREQDTRLRAAQTSPAPQPTPAPATPQVRIDPDPDLPEDEIILYEEDEPPAPPMESPAEAILAPVRPQIDPTNREQVWEALLDTLTEQKHMVVASYVREAGSPGKFENASFEVCFHQRAVREMLGEQDQALLEKYLTEIIGKPTRVIFRMAEEKRKEAPVQTPPRNSTRLARLSAAGRDESVRMVMEVFGGQVIDVQ